MFTPAIKFARLRVKIFQHEIFTPVHCGKFIMALNFQLGKNIIASNIDPFPQGEKFGRKER